MAEGIEQIEEAAAEAGRKMDPEHYGVLIPYLPKKDDRALAALAERVKVRRPDVEVDEVVATSHERIVEMIQAYLDVGASKFVLFPSSEPDDWTTELEALAGTALPLQT